MYFDPVWNISNDVVVRESTMKPPQIFYPFKTTVTANYESHDLIGHDSNTYKISVGNWFKPVYYQGVVGETRFLDYYTDFVGYDQYSYMLEFDKAMKLVDDLSDITVKNDYADLSFTVRQSSEKSLLINCNYIINARMVERDNIDQVEEINQVIEAIQHTELHIAIAD
jgi:hypothetical protein